MVHGDGPRASRTHNQTELPARAGVLLGAFFLLASILAGSPAAADTMLYPDLVSAAPRNGTAPSVITFDGRSFLGVRFDGLITNAGSGPLDLYGNPSAGTVAQRVKSGDEWVEVANPPVLFETADMHNHWHLMRINRYSLWNENRSAEVAPSEKVGFCLYDIEQNGQVPPTPAYYTGPVVQWCQAGNPNATELHMGISAGWSDLYAQGLTFQWVDVSNVAPGTYWLASQVDPDNVIVEANEANNTLAFASAPTIVPGYLARPVGPVAVTGPVKAITLVTETYGVPGQRRFRIVEPPQHGTLSVVTGAAFAGPTVEYQPNPGYVGQDSFRFVAFDQASPYPTQPPAATVTLDVSQSPDVSVAISGAPAAMTAGTAVQLTATVTNAGPAVEWSVNGVVGGSVAAGTISPAGLYTAPATVPGGGSVSIRATSVEQEWAYDQVTIAIEPGQRAPVVTNPGPQRHVVGETPLLSITAVDPDGDSLTYGATNLPPGLFVNQLSGSITGRPTTPGVWTVTFTASDGHASGSATFQWTIVSAPPTIAPIDDLSIDEGQSITIPLDISDPQGYAFICTLFAPGYVSKNAANTQLTIAPGYADAGAATVTVSATNDTGASSSESFVVSVRNVNRAPTLGALDNIRLDEGTTVRLDPGASDPDGDQVVVGVAGPRFVSLDPATGEVVLAPGFADDGIFGVAVTATDALGASVTANFTVTVDDVNRPPALSIVSGVSVAEGSQSMVPFSASDPDGDPVSMSLSGPPFASMGQGFVLLTPGYDDAGSYTFSVGASDGRGQSQARTVTVVVSNTNRAPTVAAISPRTMAEGETLVVPVAGFDPDGDSTAVTVSGASFATVVGSSIFLEPGYGDAGAHQLTVQVVDEFGAEAETSLAVTVLDVNRPPEIGLPATLDLDEGSAMSVVIDVGDPDGDPVTLSLAAPPYVTLSGQSLVLTPGYDDAGGATVTVTATDSGGLSRSASLIVTIADVNRRPSISSVAPVIVSEGESIVRAITAQDPDGDELAFTLSGPGFVQFGASELQLHPGYLDAGTYVVTLTGSDGRGGSATVEIAVTVLDVNRPPTLSLPARMTVTAGTIETLPVVAYDPDGDAITTTLQGAPFASLVDGALRLAPSSDDIGEHTLSVRVTDGRGGDVAVDLAVRVVAVNQPPLAVITASVPRRSAPVIVRFSGAHSLDPEGGRLLFAWDLDGDGAFDDSRHLRPSMVFVTPGVHQVSLTVTDEAGNATTATYIVDLSGAPGVRSVVRGAPQAPSGTLDTLSSPSEASRARSVLVWSGAPEVLPDPGEIYLL